MSNRAKVDADIFFAVPSFPVFGFVTGQACDLRIPSPPSPPVLSTSADSWLELVRGNQKPPRLYGLFSSLVGFPASEGS